MHNFDNIIDFKLIRKWLLIITAYFFCGYAFKSYFSYFTLLLFFYFLLYRRYDYQLYLLILWIYINEYFNGIGYLPENPITINTSPFLAIILVLTFFQEWRQIIFDSLSNKIFIAQVIFGLIILFSTLVHEVSVFKILRFFFYYIVYIVILVSKFDIVTYKKLFNQIFAIGFFQIPIAWAQYLQIVPAPRIRDASASYVDAYIQLFLDDAACGTFGPASSPDLSLFLTFLAFIFLINFIITKKYIYLFSGMFLLMQYIVVDSKTVLGISGLIGFLIVVLSTRIRQYLIRVINFKIIIVAILFSAGFYISIKSYYERGLYDNNESQLGDIEEMLEFSKRTVGIHIAEWGKIQGFYHVKELQKKSGGDVNIFFGFGLGESWYREIIANKTYFRFFLRGYANHFLDTSSTMISLMAETGVLGLIMFIIIYLIILRNIPKYSTRFDIIKAYHFILPAFIIGILVYSFINKELKTNDASIITFWIFLALNRKINAFEIAEEDSSLKIKDSVE